MLVGEVFARMGLDSKQYKESLDRLEGVTQKKAMTLGSIFRGAFSFAIGIGVIQGFRSLSGAVTDFINTAARTEVLDVAMKSVARASGYATQALQEHRKAVMDMGIAEQEASQILTRFMQAQLDTADAAKLARVAQDAAVIAGYNSSQAAEQMTEAIAKQRPELLSAFGMTRNMNEIYKDYAVTVGKTTAQLSEAEKKQAMLNYILAEGEKIAGTYEASMGAVGKQIGSLPRYWDTLKNALAKPLALPAISVIVDGITNALKNAINWAEANKAALQTWGQTAANVASYVVRGFQFVTRTFAENWGMIRFTATALLTYAVATRTAAGATALLQTATVLLNGNMAAQAGLLGFVSNVVTFYKMQMLGAAATSNIFTAALMRVRAALIAVHTALGPIGWAILLISGLIAGGMALWNKYTQSLQKATQAASPADLAKGFRDLEKSTQKSANATEEQADALKEAGKAASKNLQSFDEFHELTKDTADTDFSNLLSGEDLTAPGVSEFDMPDLAFAFDFDDAIAQAKEEMGGFWGWLWNDIKSKAASAWQGISGFLSGTWQRIVNLARPIWEPLAPFFAWLWEGIKTMITAVWDAIGPYLMSLWSGIVTIAQTVWGVLGSFFIGLWSGIKTAVEVAWGLIQYFLATYWLGIIELAKAVWLFLGPFFEKLWEGVKKVAVSVWSFLSTVLPPIWNAIVAMAKTIWSAIGPFFELLWAGVKWAFENIWRPLAAWLEGVWNGIKTVAETVWNVIQKVIVDPFNAARQTVESIANAVKDVVQKAWDFIAGSIKAVKDVIYDYIVEPFLKAKETILGIVDSAKNWGKNLISNIVDGIKAKAAAVKSAVQNVASTIKGWLGFSSPTKEGPGRYADQWAPNLMRMYAQGILANVGMVQSAAKVVAQSLVPMAIQPSLDLSIGASSLKDSILEALMQREIVIGGSSGQEFRIVMMLDNGEVLADMLVDPINRTAKNRGYAPVFRPAT